MRYPGVDALVGDLTVAEVLDRSAIEEVVVLPGAPAAPDAVLRTRDFVRPEWRDGRLVLLAMPAGPGRLVPNEVASPSRCCTTHR